MDTGDVVSFILGALFLFAMVYKFYLQSCKPDVYEQYREEARKSVGLDERTTNTTRYDKGKPKTKNIIIRNGETAANLRKEGGLNGPGNYRKQRSDAGKKRR